MRIFTIVAIALTLFASSAFAEKSEWISCKKLRGSGVKIGEVTVKAVAYSKAKDQVCEGLKFRKDLVLNPEKHFFWGEDKVVFAYHQKNSTYGYWAMVRIKKAKDQEIVLDVSFSYLSDVLTEKKEGWRRDQD
ncbi:MAG: hypothetical protein OXR68_03030 [Alphaproteobacteria bacterium]|nr:hypothetical protein [Alphaproteobacteria bacterium]